MSTNRERKKALEDAYQAMPHDHTRLAAIYAAMGEADASGDRIWRIQTRYDAIIELMFYGDGGQILPLVGEFVRLFEEKPSYSGSKFYLYILYAAVGQWNLLPQLPLDQLERMKERFWDAVQRYQMYDGPYYEREFVRAQRQGQWEKMEEAWQKWQRAKNNNDCKGCVQYFRVQYAVAKRDGALAEREAQPILNGSLYCANEPQNTLSLLLGHALDYGTKEEAARWAEQLRLQLMKESPVMEYDSGMLLWLAYSDPEEGLRMFERFMPENWRAWDQEERFYLFKNAWVLFHRLAEQNKPVQVELPEEFPLWKQDGQYNAGELADWFYAQAQKIGNAFDTRDGYPYFAHELELAERYLK